MFFGVISPLQTRGFGGSGKVNLRSENRRFGRSVRVGDTWLDVLGGPFGVLNAFEVPASGASPLILPANQTRA